MIQGSPAAGKTLLTLVAVCLGAAGCTSYSSYDPERAATLPPLDGTPEDVGAVPQGDASLPGGSAERGSNQARVRQENAASAALLAQSRDERAVGSYAEAGASLERALRIDPNNPALWIELAEVKAAEGDYEQAGMMARKALTLAGADRSIAERADRILYR